MFSLSRTFCPQQPIYHELFTLQFWRSSFVNLRRAVLSIRKRWLPFSLLNKVLTSQPRHWIDELGMITSLLCIHCTRDITCKFQGNCFWSPEITLSKKKKKTMKKEGNTTNSFFQKSKILYGSPYKNKKNNLSFFFAQNGRSRSRDLTRIFFYTEWHNFLDSLLVLLL